MSAFRAGLLVLASLTAGCLEVIDHGGVDAGLDAGHDGGPDAGCSSSMQCGCGLECQAGACEPHGYPTCASHQDCAAAGPGFDCTPASRLGHLCGRDECLLADGGR